MRKCLDAIYNSRDRKRYRCELFRELPDAHAYPDYYKLIQTPISLNEVSQPGDGVLAKEGRGRRSWREFTAKLRVYVCAFVRVFVCVSVSRRFCAYRAVARA